MIDEFIAGLMLVLQWPTLGFLMLGVFTGIWLGVIPGLGGVIGLVLLLPFTYGMDPVPAFALLLGMFAVTSTSDTISSVMLGIPGTAASQATILDGYPMAKQGRAARALGAAFTVSAFGGVFGALVLAISLPLIMPIILTFGPPELFALAVLGLTMIGALSGSSLGKALVVAALGVLVATVGYAETVPIPRFSFGLDYLLVGVPMIPAVLGLFAIPEVLELAVRNTAISRVEEGATKDGRMRDGIRDAAKHWWLATRCATIGTYVGMLPGLGSAIVDWVAYGHAVQSASDKSGFGNGDVRGVIAPEAANNASRGGSLIPTVAFGIPGSLSTAILLGALVIQGLKPGPDMLTTHLDLTFSMVWSIAIANIAVSVILIFLSKPISRLAFVPGHLLVPGVVLFVFMGAWLGGASLGDWVTVMVFAMIGIAMKVGDWPRPPLILALILAPLMENNLLLSIRLHDGYGWLGTPVVLGILALTAITLVHSTIKARRQAKPSDELPPHAPLLSVPIAAVLLSLFLWAGLTARDWPEAVMLFPAVAAGVGAVCALIVLASSLRGCREASGSQGLGSQWVEAASETQLAGTAAFLGYLLGMILLMLVVGQKIAIPVFIAVYLVRWGGVSWRLSLGYALAGWAVLVVFYDQVMHLFWYPSWLSQWLPGNLPAAFPRWLFF